MHGNIFDQHGSPGDEHRPIDLFLLQLMLDSYEMRPWAVKEITAQVDNRTDAVFALRRLYASRLVTSVETYVIPTRPAIAYYHLQRFVEPEAHSLTDAPPRPTR